MAECPPIYLNIVAASSCRQNFLAPKSGRKLLLQLPAAGPPRRSSQIQAAGGSASTHNRRRGRTRGYGPSNPLPVRRMSTDNESASALDETASAEHLHEASMPCSVFTVGFQRFVQSYYANSPALLLSCLSALLLKSVQITTLGLSALLQGAMWTIPIPMTMMSTLYMAHRVRADPKRGRRCFKQVIGQLQP
jgi:hypothetical protein